MVSQCRNLYENDSACGSLCITVDGSKFLLNFSYSVKVLLNVTISQDLSCSSKDDRNEQSDTCKFTKNGASNIDVHESLSEYELLSDQNQRLVICKKSIGEAKRGESHNAISEALGTDFDSKGKDSLQNIQNENFYVSHQNGTVLNTGCDDIHKAQKKKEIKNNAVIGRPSPHKRSIPAEAKGNSVTNTASNLYHQCSHDSDGADFMQEEGRHDVSQNINSANIDISTVGCQKISTCRDCYTNFETTQALKDHRKVKTSDIKCDECLEVFQYQAFLQVHKLANHSSSGATFVQKDNQYWYKCNTCGALAESLIKLQIHNLTHTGEGAFQCCLCHQQFWEMKDLTAHVSQSHRLSWKVRCWTCNKWFENRAARSKHKINCSKFKCHLCNAVFTHKTIRNQHFNDVHPNDVLKCKLCKHMFSSQEELVVHSENHSKRKKKQCPTCGLLFNDVRRHMLTHKSSHELAESDYIYCDKCPERYCNKSSYNRHQRLKHPPDNSYKCTNCPKAFGHHEPLRRHMKRCKPALLHSCHLCRERYATIDQLNSHTLSHTNDNKDSSSSVGNHITLRCPVCMQSFVYRNSFEDHIRLRHPNFVPNQLTNPVTTGSVSVKTIQDSTATATYDSTPFVYSTNGLMEAVIQGITDLTNAPTPLKF